MINETEKEREERWLEYQTERFYASLIPYGSRDVYEAIKTVIDGGHEGDWLADKILEYIDECDAKLEDIDPNYIAYDSLLQEARSDIEELTGIDILNDLSSEVYVAGNYMCTTLDYSGEVLEELKEVLEKIKEEDRTQPIDWLVEELN